MSKKGKKARGKTWGAKTPSLPLSVIPLRPSVYFKSKMFVSGLGPSPINCMNEFFFMLTEHESHMVPLRRLLAYEQVTEGI